MYNVIRKYLRFSLVTVLGDLKISILLSNVLEGFIELSIYLCSGLRLITKIYGWILRQGLDESICRLHSALPVLWGITQSAPF